MTAERWYLRDKATGDLFTCQFIGSVNCPLRTKTAAIAYSYPERQTAEQLLPAVAERLGGEWEITDKP